MKILPAQFQLKRVCIRLIFAYLIICLFMWGFQRHLMYMPQAAIQPPQAYRLSDFSVLTLQTSDGLHLQVWHHPAKSGYPTIIYFHGNGGNLAGRAHYFQLLAKAGFGVFAPDYRGYGASEGTPSEEGFYKDARATMDYAAKILHLSPSQLIIYGESIGTGVAVQMATEYSSAALVLQSPFTSIEAIAENDYPWLPVHCLLQDRFDSLGKIAHTHTALLLLHGEKDSVVPIRYGKILFDHAPEPKEAIYLSENGHIDFDLQQLTEILVKFCNKYHFIKE